MARSRRDRRPNELRAAADRDLRYEIDMLIATNDLLEQVNLLPWPRGTEVVVKNALLESFAVHARSLLQFFYGPKRYDDDTIAEDFFDEPTAWREACPNRTEVLSTVDGRVGKEIAHLTYARRSVTDEMKRWGHSIITKDLGDIATRFTALIPKGDEGQQWRALKPSSQPIQIESTAVTDGGLNRPGFDGHSDH